MAGKKVQKQSSLLGFLSKESSESRVDHSRKEGKALANPDYEKNEDAVFKSTGSLNFHGFLQMNLVMTLWNEQPLHDY